MKVKTLEDLFLDQIRDVYDAEKRLIKALPKMAKAAASPDLKAGFLQHLEETKQQAERLEQACQTIGVTLKRKKCKAMEGLVEEGEEIIDLKGDDQVRDAGLIAAAQKVEHYEIASYGCLCTWAEQLGYEEALPFLKENLGEEKATDQKLTELAEQSVNQEAAAK